MVAVEGRTSDRSTGSTAPAARELVPKVGAESESDAESSEDPLCGSVKLFEDARVWERRLARVHLLLAFLATVLVGVLFFVFNEGWGWIESLYVITQAFTTIGYGDMTVQGDDARIFLSFYILWLLVIVAYFLNTVVQDIMDRQKGMMRTHLEKVQAKTMEAAAKKLHVQERQTAGLTEGTKSLLWAFANFALFAGFGTIFFGSVEGCSCSYGMTEKPGCNADNVCEVGFVKNYREALYMSIITMTTVGFGDYTPVTALGRFVGCFWMMAGVVVTANFISAVQGVLSARELKLKLHTAAMVDEEHLAAEFRAMDEDNTGAVSQAEFICWVLKRTSLVDSGILDQIESIFRQMDTTGDGTVSLNELRDFQKHLKEVTE